MKKTNFFVSRPIFSSVISIVIVLAGLVASQVLPIAQYPRISPPTVTISASYPGASAETLSRTVAAPIEDQLSGVENMLYFNSSSSSSGNMTITVTFAVGTDPDQAAINVSNRVAAAESRLPADVRSIGVTVRKRSDNILQVVAVTGDPARYDTLYLSNFASINVVDDLKRLKGVGDVSIFGAQDYSMRVWLKPDRMAQLGVSSTEIATAIRSQNAQNAAGKIGAEPAAPDQMLTFTVTAKGRLLTPEEFGDIVIRAGGPSGMLRIKDVATVELGAYNYSQKTRLDGRASIGVAIFLQTGANALEVATRVHERMEELKKNFPEGVDYVVPYDTTLFIKASITEVLKTLGEALLLVLGVVYLFLQNWRATLIPMIAVPVSLIGTFAGLWALGFSINTLTLFAMVLAIGIVVDDAIVVLENVERLMHEEGLLPFDAAVKAMHEVSAAVVAIVLVLCAVFIPIAFLGGLTGILYQQFAVTVSISVVISGIVALTLTPAMCAVLLKKKHEENKLFIPFNRLFERFTKSYTNTVGFTLRHSIVGVLAFVLVCGVSFLLVRTVPESFVPAEDQGILFASVNLPDGATLARTDNTMQQINALIAQDKNVAHTIGVAGFDMIGGGQKTSAGTIFLPMKDWKLRDDSITTSQKKFTGMGMALPDGMAMFFNPPAIQGLGTTGGFELFLQDRVEGDTLKLAAVLNDFLDTLRKRPELTGINSFFRATSPQLFIEVDEAKALSLGIALDELYGMLQSTLGQAYVNDFNIAGRVYRVQMQAEAQYRQKPEDIGRIHVRSKSGKMIPISAVSTVKTVVGSEQIDRFNGFVSAKVLGSGVPGKSSGEAISLVEKVAKETLPEGYYIAWTGQAYQEKAAAGSSLISFSFAIIMVFLILAAQYEKWSLPLAVIMAVPFALFGALIAVFMRSMPNDVYFQIGLIVLVGLAAKNAILIVEFAAQKYAEGMSAVDAAVEAARLRFRPIIMTSLAFVLGVFPLVKATGAGAASRQSMGTGVFGGMIAATFIATIFIPLFFKWLERGKQLAPSHLGGEEDTDEENNKGQEKK